MDKAMVDQLTDLEDRIMELKSENEMLKSENFSLKYANENLKKDYYKTKKNLELLEGFTKRDVKELRAILTSQIKNKFGIVVYIQRLIILTLKFLYLAKELSKEL